MNERKYKYEGIVVDLVDGSHIMYINPGSDLALREEYGSGVTHIYNYTKRVFSFLTIDMVDVHWINNVFDKEEAYEDQTY